MSLNANIFNNYRIVRILVDESNEEFIDETNHCLYVTKSDGMSGRFERPVIDMTCHQYQTAKMKRAILYPYPLKYRIINEIETNFTRTFTELLLSLRTQFEECREDIHRFSIVVGESII